MLAQTGGSAGPFDSGHPLAGLLALVGFCGALACLATRDSGPAADGSAAPGVSGSAAPGVSAAAGGALVSASIPAAGGGSGVLDSGAVGPLVGGLLLVGFSAFTELGLDPLALFYPTIIAVLALSVLESRVPHVPTAVRRALVTPYLLTAGGLFWNVVHQVVGGIDFRAFFGGTFTGVSSGVGVVLGALTLFAAVYYAMLIYAPRQIVEREGGPLVWLARFTLFLASVGLGLGWLSLLAG